MNTYFNTLKLVNIDEVKELLNAANWDYQFSGHDSKFTSDFVNKLEATKWTKKQLIELLNETATDYVNEFDEAFNYEINREEDFIDVSELIYVANKTFAKYVGDNLARSIMSETELRAFESYTFTPII